MKEIYVCVTLYHLYISILIINKRKSKNRSLILLNANNLEIYNQFCRLKPSLQANGYQIECRLRSNIKDILGFENRKQYKFIKQILGINIEKNFLLFNFAWNLQYIYSNANLLFKKCKTAYFIEEGVMTPINPLQPKWKVLIKKATGTVINFYKEEKLKGIYVQNIGIYPELWEKKLKLLDVNGLLKFLDEDTKKKIAELFLGDLVKKENLFTTENAVIIYTQPLSEDGYITEKEKIKYYTTILTYYSKYGKPIIKIHPRDQTQYSFDIPCLILPGYFPSEILNMLNMHFKYAVGICTSAVLTTDAQFKINLNDNFLRDRIFKMDSLT